MKQFLVDGYNLAHKLGGKLTAQRLQEVRSDLERRLQKYAAGAKCDITVVYDGRGTIGAEDTNGVIKIIFTPAGESADTRIKRLIDDSTSTSRLKIVSSDLSIRQYAKLSGVETVSSEDFLKELATTLDKRAQPAPRLGNPKRLGDDRVTDKPATLSDADLEEWKKLFNT